MQEIGGASSNMDTGQAEWAPGRARMEPWVGPWVNRFVGLYKALNRSILHFSSPLLSLRPKLERESLQMTLSSPTRHSTSDVVAHGGAAASELQSSPI
jgi:hypothetical protein